MRPLSTNVRPKAFISITKDRKTMFRKTVERIYGIVLPENIVVVANRLHARLVKRDLPWMDKNNILLEPVSRNTAPAIAYVASAVDRRRPDAVLVVLPADHYITDEIRYRASLKVAIDFVRTNEDAIVALGVKPYFPATVYGYVQLLAPSYRLQAKMVYKVKRFTEKPDLQTAAKFLRDGRYLWNAGIFVFKARTILNAIKKFAPDIAKGFIPISAIGNKYKSLPDISIDYAVMERAGNIYCVKSSCGWNDIGSFQILKEVLRKESRRFIERGDKILKIL